MEVEVTVYSDRKDGLLRAMGTVVIGCGFTLLRQRMLPTPNGIELWLNLKGEQGRLLELEDQLSSHPLVTGFEANHLPTASAHTPAARPTGALSHTTPGNTQAYRKAGSTPPSPKITSTGNGKRNTVAVPATDIIEAALPSLARSYPRIFPQLLDLRDQIAEDQWGVSLKFIGIRVGAWVYKRDYALGGQLDLKSAMRHIALPAMKTLLPTEAHDYAIHVKNNPFCMPGSRCRNGEFFCGFLQGLLQDAGGSGRVVVREIECRSEGQKECVFEVVD